MCCQAAMSMLLGHARPTPCVRAVWTRASCPVVCKAGKRRPIIKRRSVSPVQRRKLKYRDEPRELTAGDLLNPGQLTSLINSVNGPLQLTRLLQQHAVQFSGTQASMALARLAGFALYEELDEEQLAAQARSARKCALLLKQRIGDCDVNSYARASYALARLGLRDEELLAALVHETEGRLDLLPPDGLTALLAGLATFGHRPSEQWLSRFCLEVYARYACGGGWVPLA